MLKFLQQSRLLYIFLIFGTGIKGGAVPVVDELALITFTLFNKNKWKAAYKTLDLYKIMILWFLLSGLVGLISVGIVHNNINIIRYVLIPLCLFLYIPPQQPPAFKFLYWACLLFILVNMALPFYGSFAQLPVAWWQDTLWTGTAYAVIGVFFCGVILALSSNDVLVSMFIFMLVFFTGSMLDSRLLMALALLLWFAELFPQKKWNKRSFKQHYIIIFTTLFIAIAGTSAFQSVLRTFSDLVITQSKTRDADRKEQFYTVLKLYKKDKLHFLFGHGILSHQYDMKDYLAVKSEKRVRPTGFPAFVFDGGIILLILIMASGFWSMIKILQQWQRIETPLRALFLPLSIPAVALLIIPITNTMEMVLWWLALHPKGLGFLLLRQYQKSMNTMTSFNIEELLNPLYGLLARIKPR